MFHRSTPGYTSSIAELERSQRESTQRHQVSLDANQLRTIAETYPEKLTIEELTAPIIPPDANLD
jgi:hypothetical protein